MLRGRRRLVIAVAVLAVLAVAGCSRPPPTAVCAGCDEGLAAAADRLVGDVTVERSEAHLRLDRDGGALLVARVRLSGPGVDRLRANASAVDRLVERARARARRGYAGGGVARPALDTEPVDARMDGRTLVARFRVADVSEPAPGGVTLVDRFVRRDGDARDDPVPVATDTFAVHAPAGEAALVAPPDATVADGGRRIVWTTREVGTGAYLAFGPPPGRLTWPLGRLAVALAVFGWATGPAAVVGAVPTALVGLLAVGFARGYAGGGDDSASAASRSRPGPPLSVLAPLTVAGAVALLVGVGVLRTAVTDPALRLLVLAPLGAAGAALSLPVAASAAGVAFPVSGSLVVGAVLLGAVVIGTVVAVRRSRQAADANADVDADSPALSARMRRWAGPAALATGITATGWLLVAATPAGPIPRWAGILAAVLPAVAFPAVGYATVRTGGPSARAAAAVAVAAAPVLALAWIVSGGANGVVIGAVFLAGWGIAAVLGGAVLFYGARRLARPD